MEKKSRVSRIQQYCVYFSLHFTSYNIQGALYHVHCLHCALYNVLFTFFLEGGIAHPPMLTLIVLVAGSPVPLVLHDLHRSCHVAYAYNEACTPL